MHYHLLSPDYNSEALFSFQKRSLPSKKALFILYFRKLQNPFTTSQGSHGMMIPEDRTPRVSDMRAPMPWKYLRISRRRTCVTISGSVLCIPVDRIFSYCEPTQTLFSFLSCPYQCKTFHTKRGRHIAFCVESFLCRSHMHKPICKDAVPSQIG